jgi:hypothetical protein
LADVSDSPWLADVSEILHGWLMYQIFSLIGWCIRDSPWLTDEPVRESDISQRIWARQGVCVWERERVPRGYEPVRESDISQRIWARQTLLRRVKTLLRAY